MNQQNQSLLVQSATKYPTNQILSSEQDLFGNFFACRFFIVGGV